MNATQPPLRPPADARQETLRITCPGRRGAVGALASKVPLVMLPFLGKPIIAYLLEDLAKRNAGHIKLLVCDRPDAVSGFVGKGEQWGLQVDIEAAEEEQPADGCAFETLPQIPGLRLWDSYAGWAAALGRGFQILTSSRIGMRVAAPGIFVSNSAFISGEAELVAPCWVGQNAHISSGAVIGPYSVIEDGVFVDTNSHVKCGVVGPKTYVGKSLDVCKSLAWESQLVSLDDGATLDIVDTFMLSPIGINGSGFFDQMRTRMISLLIS